MAEHAGELDDTRSRLTDISSGLTAMRANHFEFAADHDEEGAVVALMGVRVHHGVIDIFELHGEDDATATRFPDRNLHLNGRDLLSERNIMLARTTLWHTHGSASSVIDDLLNLSNPDIDSERTDQPPKRNGHRVAPKRWPATAVIEAEDL